MSAAASACGDVGHHASAAHLKQGWHRLRAEECVEAKVCVLFIHPGAQRWAEWRS